MHTYIWKRWEKISRIPVRNVLLDSNKAWKFAEVEGASGTHVSWELGLASGTLRGFLLPVLRTVRRRGANPCAQRSGQTAERFSWPSTLQRVIQFSIFYPFATAMGSKYHFKYSRSPSGFNRAPIAFIRS